MAANEPLHHIPFNRPFLVGHEFEYIAKSIDGMHISGDGPFTSRCQNILQSTLNVPKALLTTSCTHALDMAALLLEIQPNDEVIVPSFTFTSSINAFVLRGAVPRFVDIRPDTLNLDERQIEGALTLRTKAIVVVHYAGVGCEMEPILEIGRKRGIAIVEDNAHGLFGRYRGRALGTFGCLATQSFHETKNVTCGEGGALLINDPCYIERAEIIREKGTDRSQFFRGLVDKYSWVDIGSSYLPSDILGAFLCAQLEAAEEIQARRQRIWEYYYHALESWAATSEASLPYIPPHCEQAWHMFYIVMPSLQARDGLIQHLRRREITAPFHYLPLHLSPMGLSFQGRPGDCPITESVSGRLVRLPFYNGLTAQDQDRIIESVISFVPSATAAVE